MAEPLLGKNLVLELLWSEEENDLYCAKPLRLLFVTAAGYLLPNQPTVDVL